MFQLSTVKKSSSPVEFQYFSLWVIKVFLSALDCLRERTSCRYSGSSFFCSFFTDSSFFFLFLLTFGRYTSTDFSDALVSALFHPPKHRLLQKRFPSLLLLETLPVFLGRFHYYHFHFIVFINYIILIISIVHIIIFFSLSLLFFFHYRYCSFRLIPTWGNVFLVCPRVINL